MHPLISLSITVALFETSIAQEVCNKRAHRDKRYYIEIVPRQGDIIRSCPAGTIFYEEKCACDFVHLPTSDGLCRPSAFFPFDQNLHDQSPNPINVGLTNISLTDSGTAYLNGHSEMNIKGFAGTDWGNKLVIKFKFRFEYSNKFMREMSQTSGSSGSSGSVFGDSAGNNTDKLGGMPKQSAMRARNKQNYQALATNWQGQDSQRPSIMVVANQGDVQLALKTYNSDTAAVLSVPVVEGGWNDFTLIYDGQALTGVVENWKGTHKNSVNLQGDVERRQTGLLVGSCQGFASFHGEIDDLSVYKCLTPTVEELRDKVVV